MFQATRLRLAIWYTTVTAIVMMLFATEVYLYVRSTLVERIDDTLKHVVEVVERSLVIESVSPEQGTYRVNIEASFRNNGFGVEDDHIDLEWFNPNGELFWSTFEEPLTIPILANYTAKTVSTSSDYLLRQVTQRIEIERYVLGYLRVSHPWFEVTKPSRRLMLDLSLGIIVMIICVAFIGWLLSGIAIQPVRDSYQSLKQFTADASHELRNPIAMIQTNVQMALAYPQAEPDILEKQLKLIERLTQRLGRLVNDLLFLARSDSGMVQINYQPIPLDALLLEVIEEQRLVAQQKGVSLSLKIADNIETSEDIFTVMGDWDQLARLFTNLISNAIEYTPSDNPAATVKVKLQKIKRESQSHIGSRHAQIEVKVQDNGRGIPEIDLPHIFDRFYRVDPARLHYQEGKIGSGLGLAIAKAIAENHQGQITVESVVKVGTTFTVIMPANLKPLSS